MKSALIASAATLAVTSFAAATMTGWSVTATNVFNSGQSLTRYEVFGNFNGATDTLLNVFNFQATGGWAAHASAAAGFWHKDNASGNSQVLMQEFGTWAPQLTGNATLNRPFDSFLLIGGTPVAANTTTADPSWNGGGANPDGWSVAQIPTGPAPLYNDLGWFNASPPNLQGRVGTAPNTATTVKIAQFILSANDTSFRNYSLTAGYNNGAGGAVQFFTGTFSLPAPGAVALLGLAGLVGRRRR
jgi:hypothetical protein